MLISGATLIIKEAELQVMRLQRILQPKSVAFRRIAKQTNKQKKKKKKTNKKKTKKKKKKKKKKSKKTKCWVPTYRPWALKC